LREGVCREPRGHPGAVTVIDDVATADGKVFLVMELLEGESLGARLRRIGAPCFPAGHRRLPIAFEVSCISRQTRGIGRDHQADNVFRHFAGALKLLDFGIARVRISETSASMSRARGHARDASLMAPEQVHCSPEDVDPRTDLWGVGATMFTC